MLEVRGGNALRAVVVCSALLLLTGCAAWGLGPRALRSCPGALQSTDAIERASVARIRLGVSGDALELPLHVVVQSRPGERVVIGFNPFGAKLFSVVQHGEQLQIEALPSALLPVAPLNLVRDLHRALFLVAPAPAAGDPTSSALYDDIRAVDSWSDGRRVRREFPPTASWVEFAADGSIQIHNPTCGYSAELEMLSEAALQ